MLTIWLLSLAATDFWFFDVMGFALTLFWPISAVALVLSRRSTSKHNDKQILSSFYVMVGTMALCLIASSTGSRATAMVLSAAHLLIAYWAIRQVSILRAGELEKALRLVLFAFSISTLVALLLISLDQTAGALAPFGRATFEANLQTWRAHALSSEPSYAAFIVTVAWLGLRRLNPSARFTDSREFMLATLVCALVVCYRSIYGLVLLALVFSTYLDSRSHLRNLLLLISACLLLALMSGEFLERVAGVARAITAFDLAQWQAVDGSSLMRVAPTIFLFDGQSLASVSMWLGHGASASTSFFGSEFGELAEHSNDVIRLGFIPAFIYDYGLLGTFVVLRFLLACCRGPFRFQARACLVLMLFNANFNTQLFWFVCICLMWTSFAGRAVSAKTA